MKTITGIACSTVKAIQAQDTSPLVAPSPPYPKSCALTTPRCDCVVSSSADFSPDPSRNPKGSPVSLYLLNLPGRNPAGLPTSRLCPSKAWRYSCRPHTSSTLGPMGIYSFFSLYISSPSG